MSIDELLVEINKIDIEKYYGIGCVRKFNSENPNLIDDINQYCIEIGVTALNKKLPAKLKFLKTYNGDIRNITDVNGNIMTYDYKSFDFRSIILDSTNLNWVQTKNIISDISEFYSKDETIELLKNIYLNYFGKSGNRKLIRDNIKLYASLYYHTKFMDNLNRNKNKFTMRILILINEYNIYCHKHTDNLLHWTLKNNALDMICSKCNPHKYPSKEFFIHKYGDDWEKHLTDRQIVVKNNKTNSLEWFKRKYGPVDGLIEYNKYVDNLLLNINKLKGVRYSKISQDLFWTLFDTLTLSNDNTHFAELNNELFIRIPSKYNYKSIIFVDFIHKNNIIEYNGEYWHNKEDDDLRYSILKDMGYNILPISSNEYSRYNKNKETITKCINFLTC